MKSYAFVIMLLPCLSLALATFRVTRLLLGNLWEKDALKVNSLFPFLLFHVLQLLASTLAMNV